MSRVMTIQEFDGRMEAYYNGQIMKAMPQDPTQFNEWVSLWRSEGWTVRILEAVA